jgi:hypothetical protein
MIGVVSRIEACFFCNIWEESKNSSGSSNCTTLLLLCNIVHYLTDFQVLSYHTGYSMLLQFVIYLFVF